MDTQSATTTEIKLVQKPVIEHQLQEIGKKVTDRLAAQNIDSLVATPDTVKALKELRAELNKEYNTFEEQRKTLKKAVTDPLTQFEALYNTEIKEKYTDAVSKLKDKIATVEDQIKDEKKKSLTIYFEELCVAEKIDFLKWENLNIEILLSTSEKKYKEQINEFVSRVKDDITLIATEEFEAEIMVEYRKTLNASSATTSVRERKEQERQEAARILRERTASRTKTVESLGMTREEITKTYEYNDKILITEVEIETLEDQEWREMVADLEFQIKHDKAEKKAAQRTEEISSGQPVQQTLQPATPVAAPVSKPVAAPVAKPVNGETERTVTASFKVTGPYSKVKALGQYMRDNGITYTDI